MYWWIQKGDWQSMPITSIRRSWPMQFNSDLWKVPYMWAYNNWKWPMCHKNNWYTLDWIWTILLGSFVIFPKLVQYFTFQDWNSPPPFCFPSWNQIFGWHSPDTTPSECAWSRLLTCSTLRVIGRSCSFFSKSSAPPWSCWIQQN